MSMTYKTICISSGCSLQVPYNWEIIIKQNNGMNLFTTTQHQSPYSSKSYFKGAILDTYNNN